MKLPEILKHKGILTSWRGYPYGSVERAKALGIEVWSAYKRLDSTVELWEAEKKLVEENRCWEVLGLKSLDHYIQAVTGKSTEEADRCIAERRKKGGQPGNQNRSKEKTNNNNIIIRTKQGTTKSYLENRLRLKHPDIFANLKTYPSVHAAAVEAGIVKRMIQCQPTVEGFAKAITKHLTGSQVLELKGMI